jgi:N-acetylglutamate synthase-like GNAT family acetyltransferase
MVETVALRPAQLEDLDDINRVIEAAVMGWDLPERVKRLSLSSYLYTRVDFDHLEMVVAENNTQCIVGVATWESADEKDVPHGQAALLLHGIYVEPAMQGYGIGSQLFHYAEAAVEQHQAHGLLVKAQASANSFFVAQGMRRLPDNEDQQRYANRFWKSAATCANEI